MRVFAAEDTIEPAALVGALPGDVPELPAVAALDRWV